ncbi:MAG: hypothetical protein AAFR98_11795 [Pseudomonadota bacterium]
MIPRRDPNDVMRLSRLGSLHQCRLSFMRQLTRRMADEAWQITRPRFDVDASGVGVAIYRVFTGTRAYSLVAFAHDLPADQRSDRVIATAWDATFTLFDGDPTDADIDRLRKAVPVQEAGRITDRELTLSRANRSVRLWTHVIDALAAGRQPDRAQIDAVGYLMRTTAVYGSGKFGAADRDVIADRSEFEAPFQAEMLTVYLIRVFVRDLVNQMARSKNPHAVPLAPEIAQRLGIGNSTGLGMAPFLMNHPDLINNWIMVREEALSRVRSQPSATSDQVSLFKDLWARNAALMADWTSSHPLQMERLTELHADIALLTGRLANFDFDQNRAWDALYHLASDRGEDAQEMLASLMLEPFGDLVDGLACCMAAPMGTKPALNGQMSVQALRRIIQDHMSWCLNTDWTEADETARVWYTSVEKLEPRLGERAEEPLDPYEQPLAPGRDIASAHAALMHWPDEETTAAFLMKHPEHRHAVRRIQHLTHAPYGEIRDNTISADMLPIDLLRAKLSFFGATHFDPRSDRWVRICMYAGAPYPEDLSPETADFWIYPKGAV